MRNKPTLKQNQKRCNLTHDSSHNWTTFNFTQPQCEQLLTYNVTLTNGL
jgi:hypothetical protein